MRKSFNSCSRLLLASVLYASGIHELIKERICQNLPRKVIWMDKFIEKESNWIEIYHKIINFCLNLDEGDLTKKKCTVKS